MGLQIMLSGSKRWRFRYRFAGLPKMLSLGLYPAVSLETARALRGKARRLLAAGIDPSAERKTRALAQRHTFEHIGRLWLAALTQRVEQRKLARGTLKRSKWLPERYLFPDLGDRPIQGIAPYELLVVLKKIELLGLRDTARRAKQKCGQLWRFAIGLGYAAHDIAGDLRGLLEPPITQHHPAITDPVRLGELLRSIHSYSGRDVIAIALKLAPLLFVRPIELRTAEWAHFDLVNAQWRIPAARIKMKVQHLVPLSRQSLELLTQLRAISGKGQYLFPSLRHPTHPMPAGTLNKALRVLGYSTAEITPHGLRSTACTLLNELGWRAEAIERQLAHSVQNDIRRLYNYAQYLPERRLMMQAWADYLDRLHAGIGTMRSAIPPSSGCDSEWPRPPQAYAASAAWPHAMMMTTMAMFAHGELCASS